MNDRNEELNVRAQISDLLKDPREKRIIDLRDRADYERRHIPEAVFLERETALDSLLSESDDERPLYLYCYTGRVTDSIAEALRNNGREAYSLSDGFYSFIRLELERLNADEDDSVKRRLAIEHSIIKKFRRELWGRFTKTIKEYELINSGDKIAVCISGGKDSMLMAKLFQELSKHGERNFEAVYLVMNPGYNENNYAHVVNNLKLLGISAEIFTTDIFDTVASNEIVRGNPCYICARMRRGHLYAKAMELGCNKIALGHHFDDVIETILMGMLYSGQLQGMMPKLKSLNFPGMELIRPISLIREEDIKKWAAYNDLNFIQCACRFTESCASCGGTEKGSKRARVKEIIKELKTENPFIEINLYRSMENVHMGTMREYRDKSGQRHNFLDDY